MEENVPVLSGAPVSAMGYLDNPVPAGYFVFPDLHVRSEGVYRLEFNLYELFRREEDAEFGESLFHVGGFSGSELIWRMAIKSHPFRVAQSRLRQQQADESQEPSQPRESRVRITRDVRMRRKEGPPTLRGIQSLAGPVHRSTMNGPTSAGQASNDPGSFSTRYTPKQAGRPFSSARPLTPESDAESVASGVPSLTAGSTAASTITIELIDHLQRDVFRLLSKDDEMRYLFSETPTRVGVDKLHRNFLRLFRQFLSDLRKEIVGQPDVWLAIQTLKHQAHNIARYASSEVFAGQVDASAWHALASQTADKMKQIQRYLSE